MFKSSKDRIFQLYKLNDSAYVKFAALRPTSFKSRPKCGEIKGKLKSKPTTTIQIQNTKYDWVRKISLKNISKLETKQERFFGVTSPLGTPSSSCSGEQCSYYGVEIIVCKIQDSPTETTTSERKFGSPTATPSSSDDF